MVMSVLPSEFSKLVFDISQQLRLGDVEALRYIYKVNDEKLTNLGVLKALEKRGVFSSKNVQGLKVLLCNIERCDLLDMLKVVEEDKRLKLCYFQAISIQQQLEAIRADLVEFRGKLECSPTERLFCSKITDRVQKIHTEMQDYLTQPLKEVCEDGRFCISSNGGNSASINASKLSGNSSTRSSTHIPKPQHLQRPNQIPTSCQSSILRVVEQTEETHRTNKDDDYDQLAPANKECNVVNNSAGVHYACTNLVAELREKRTRQQPSNSRRSPKNSMVIKSDPTISLPSSLPGTPRLVQRKVLSHCSYSVDNLSAISLGSNIPVPLRRLPSQSPTQIHSDLSDIEASGSEDSGFCDPQEFVLVPFYRHKARPSVSNTENVYTKPNKLTNAPSNVYSVPLKKEPGL